MPWRLRCPAADAPSLLALLVAAATPAVLASHEPMPPQRRRELRQLKRIQGGQVERLERHDGVERGQSWRIRPVRFELKRIVPSRTESSWDGPRIEADSRRPRQRISLSAKLG